MQTAAGFPENGRFVNASTCVMRRLTPRNLLSSPSNEVAEADEQEPDRISTEQATDESDD
jgi:hypothetical protein